jgi:hypothetical protein
MGPPASRAIPCPAAHAPGLSSAAAGAGDSLGAGSLSMETSMLDLPEPDAMSWRPGDRKGGGVWGVEGGGAEGREGGRLGVGGGGWGVPKSCCAGVCSTSVVQESPCVLLVDAWRDTWQFACTLPISAEYVLLCLQTVCAWSRYQALWVWLRLRRRFATLQFPTAHQSARLLVHPVRLLCVCACACVCRCCAARLWAPGFI